MNNLISCSECGTELPALVYAAGEILNGEQALKPGDLVKAIADGLAEEERWLASSPSSPRRSNDSIALYALSDWLGGPDPSDLVVAYQHFFGGECDRVQNARVAAETEAAP